MKKDAAFAILTVVALTVSACGSSNSNASDAVGGEPEATQVVAPAPTEAPAATTSPTITTTSPATTTTSPATTTTTSPTTTTTTSTVPPLPIDVNLIVDVESDPTGELTDLATTAAEATIRTFPELPQPDEMTIVVFSSLSYLAERHGSSYATAYSEVHPDTGIRGASGIAFPRDNFTAIRPAPSPLNFKDRDDLRSTVVHEVYHLLSGDSGDLGGPEAIVEGTARFAESVVKAALPANGDPEVFLDDLYGGTESLRAPCVIPPDFPFAEYDSATTPADEIAAAQKLERDAIRDLGCDPFDPSSGRPVRASLDGELTYSNYEEWAGYLYTWTMAQGGEPSMFVVDIWTAPGGFSERWQSVYGVPYSEFETWVADQIQADEAALEARRSNDEQ